MTDIVRANAIPFSRPVDVASIGDAGQTLRLEAASPERAALAAAAGLVALDLLEADLRLAREGRTGIRVTGEVRARVRRVCVVTLEDFDADLVEPVEIHYLPQRDIDGLAAQRARAGARSGPVDDAGQEDLDLPDPIVDGRIDVGVLAAEFMVLGLDPYPKKPGAQFVEPAEGGPVVSPFAALARLKDADQS